MAQTPEVLDEWSRVGDYLDRLAFENDRLEAELKAKKARRETIGSEAAAKTPAPEAAAAEAPVFDEQRETSRYETHSATETTQGMHLSYDALRSDLSGLMSDLNDFKQTRAVIESRLST